MPRRPRTSYPGALHDIAVNGNNRQPMFASDSDRRLCIALFAETAIRYEWRVKSYCLMDTHWHAVLATPQGNLSAGMQRLNTAYSRTFNKRNERSGHSIRHRFMSVLVEAHSHRLELTRYLPLNPVRAGLASHPEYWPWSSYRAELGLDPAPAWVETGWSIALHGSGHALRRFVAEGIAEPDAAWTPGSDPTLTPRRPAARTAPQHPALA
jgi:putative transposase